MKNSKLLTFVLSSSLPVAFLYILGLAYYEGLLESLGVSVALFPITLEIALIKGYFFLYLNFGWLFLFPAAVVVWGGIMTLANFQRMTSDAKAPIWILKLWSFEDRIMKYIGDDIRTTFRAAKVILFTIYCGLVLFLFIYLAHEDGKGKGLNIILKAQCMLTNDQGQFSFMGDTTINLKNQKAPEEVLVLFKSEKFITYYVESKNKEKSVVTVPMSEVAMTSYKSDIFSGKWGGESEKSVACKAKVNNN